MKPKNTAFFLSLIIFLTGIGGGILIDRHFIVGEKLAKYERFKKFKGPQRFDQIRDRLQERFTKKLKLSSSQQQRLRAILTRNLGGMKKRAISQDREIEAMKEATRKEVFGILTPSQAEKFTRMIQKYKARKARH